MVYDLFYNFAQSHIGNPERKIPIFQLCGVSSRANKIKQENMNKN